MDLMVDKLDIDREQIYSKKRGNKYRQLALYLIKSYTGLRLNEIERIFKMDYAAVSQATRRFKESSERDVTLKMMKHKIEIEL